MKRLVALTVFLVTAVAVAGGNVIRVSGPQFSFLIAEPEDWMLDVESAAQIAHVALYKKGADWRTTDLVIFGRFIPRSSSETVEDFLKADEEKFLAQCPFADTEDIKLPVEGPHPFVIKSYACPGIETQVVAVSRLSSHFVLFVLTAQHGGSPDPGLEPFTEVLNSFRWLGGARSLQTPDLKPVPPGKSH